MDFRIHEILKSKEKNIGLTMKKKSMDFVHFWKKSQIIWSTEQSADKNIHGSNNLMKIHDPQEKRTSP